MPKGAARRLASACQSVDLMHIATIEGARSAMPPNCVPQPRHGHNSSHDAANWLQIAECGEQRKQNTTEFQRSCLVSDAGVAVSTPCLRARARYQESTRALGASRSRRICVLVRATARRTNTDGRRATRDWRSSFPPPPRPRSLLQSHTSTHWNCVSCVIRDYVTRASNLNS